MSKLYFRYGAMNSGKSTALLQVAHNYEERGMKVIILKPAVDLKGDNQIVSRLGASRAVDALITPKQNIDHKYFNDQIACILIDEAQFLSGKQVEQIFKNTILSNTPVICYGIRTDFKTKGFGGSSRLLELSHSIEELKTICRCGNKAVLNARFIANKIIRSGSQIAIDGINNIAYESLCGKCYYNLK
jgi:thymidine kinase